MYVYIYYHTNKHTFIIYTYWKSYIMGMDRARLKHYTFMLIVYVQQKDISLYDTFYFVFILFIHNSVYKINLKTVGILKNYIKIYIGK